VIQAFQEQLISIDEMRTRMPDLRARETNLRNQIQALDTQLADRDAYLKLAADLEGFLAQLNAKTEVSTVQERRRVLRLLIKDILIGPNTITIRHRIPIRGRTSKTPDTDMEGEHCQVRWDVSSPLPANIALSALDEHFDQQWRQEMGTESQRRKRRRNGEGNWRIIRFADDFVVMVSVTVTTPRRYARRWQMYSPRWGGDWHRRRPEWSTSMRAWASSAFTSAGCVSAGTSTSSAPHRQRKR
jgi:hypothetical protein